MTANYLQVVFFANKEESPSKHFNVSLLLLRPFIFNLLVYETGDRIFSKTGKKIKIQIAGFYFCRWSKKHEYEKYNSD